MHDPSGTGESDSRSGAFASENPTPFHARLGDWDQRAGRLARSSGKDEATRQLGQRTDTGTALLCACEVRGVTKSPSKRAFNYEPDAQCVFIMRQILS